MVNTSMKISIIVALVLTAVVSVTVFGAGKQILRKPTNWQPVIGAKFPSAAAFVDANSTESKLIDGTKMNYAEILISYADPQTILVGKQTVIFRGMVRHIVIDCESGLNAPIYDFYFANPKPTRTDKPTAGLEYDAPIEKIASRVSKSSAIYQAVCPNYI